MDDFVYNDDYCLLDPYVVEGEERLRRFIHNFRAQDSRSYLGARERGAIFADAQRYLLPEHFRSFCDCIGLPVGSSGFEILRIVGEHFRQLGEVFDDRLWAAAVLGLSVSGRNSIFEELIQMDAYRPYLRVTRQAA